MATTLRLQSFTASNIRERSALRVAVEPGHSTVELESTAGFAPGDVLYVGELASEGCEKASVASVDDANVLTLTSSLELTHAAFSTVTSVLGDRIRIYRAVNVTDVPPELNGQFPCALRRPRRLENWPGRKVAAGRRVRPGSWLIISLEPPLRRQGRAKPSGRHFRTFPTGGGRTQFGDAEPRQIQTTARPIWRWPRVLDGADRTACNIAHS